jgi:hypothetical protein
MRKLHVHVIDDKMHTVYHGHSRVPRPTAPFHCSIPIRDTFRSIPISKNVLNSEDTRSFAKSGRNLGSTMALLVSIRLKRKLNFGFQCKASHSIRLMGPIWAQR